MELRFNTPIDIKEEKNDNGEITSIKVKGNAVSAGTSRNDIYYSEEELRKAAESLNGKPLILDHSQETMNIVGKVLEAKFDGGNVPFTAEVDIGEGDLIRKLRNGFINSVSIGGGYDVEASEIIDDVLHPKDIEFHELSFVTVPGVKGAGLSQVIAENYKHQHGEKMEKEKELKEELEKLKEQKKELVTERDKLTTERDELQDQLLEEEEGKEEIKEEIKFLKESIEDLKEEPEEPDVDPEEEPEENTRELIKESSDRGTVRFYERNPLGI